MSLAERLSAASPKQVSTRFCSVGHLLTELYVDSEGNKDYAALVGVLEDRRWPSTAIAKILEEEGHVVSERHLRQHRAGRHTEAQCPAWKAGVIQ